jgi:hypothetical protein
VKSSTVLLSALVMLVALAVSGPAIGARGDRIHVDVKAFANGTARYSGDIDSANPACEARRTVKVYAYQSRVMKTRTDSQGKFSKLGRAAEKGDKLTVKVPSKGECAKLIGTGEAK